MVWDLISRIKDPEFELSLEDLRVVRARGVAVRWTPGGALDVTVTFRPTVPHCSQAATIGLCLAHAVGTAIPHTKVWVRVLPGSHLLEREITQQVNDKERVAAAMEQRIWRETVLRLCKGVPGRPEYDG